LDIGKMLTFRIQKERKGFGHAVYQSRDFCGTEPALLLLGATIYESKVNKTCSQQLIELFEQVNKPLVSIHEVSLSLIEHYGILTGVWENKCKTLLRVTKFVEKPTQQYAKDFLSMKGKDDKKSYYAVFGQYILTPEIFDTLEANMITGKTEEKGEFGVTEAFAACIGTNGLTGVVLDGAMFDTGNKEAYKQTMHCF
jgi:UTP-glucose-1-phosphate uridylyltransferase